MAAAIKALNAKIRANPVLDYVCSTREFSFISFPIYRLHLQSQQNITRRANELSIVLRRRGENCVPQS